MRALWIALLTVFPTLTHAFVLKQDGEGQPVHWDTSIDFVVDEHFATLVHEPRAFLAVQAAISTYQSALPNITFSIRASPTTGVGYDFLPGAQNQNEIVVPSQWVYDPKAIAVTLLTVDSNTHRILDADIAFNAIDRKFSVFDKANFVSSLDDIQNTLTHELGHALGLAHNPDDPTVVMYPSARTGEISKRTLSQDDQNGLNSLYAALTNLPLVAADATAPSVASAVGCGSTGRAMASWMILLSIPLFLLRRRMPQSLPARGFSLGLLLLLCLPAEASQDITIAPVHEAKVVATFEVLSMRSFQVTTPVRMLMTEIEIKPRTCLKGTCPERMVLLVPGGRQGHIEQTVDGLSLPQVGAVVGITLTTFPSTGIATLKTAQMFHLGRLGEFVSFAKGLQAEGISTELPLPKSSQP